MGLEEFERKNYIEGKTDLLALQANIYANEGNMALARIKTKEALDMALAADYKNGIGTASNGMGAIEGRSGNFDLATKYKEQPPE